MDITSYLRNKGFRTFEGYSQQVSEQVTDLVQLTKDSVNIMEIGFNAGHSAEIFLKNNKKTTLTSFDLGIHGYVSVGKEFIDTTYPNRHTLILGDSAQTLPVFIQNNKNLTFDFIFIDGGHSYENAKADMDNCFYLANKDTVVALDDTAYTKGFEAQWTLGPTKVWTEYVQQNKIFELNKKDYIKGRGMSWGKYVPNNLSHNENRFP